MKLMRIAIILIVLSLFLIIFLLKEDNITNYADVCFVTEDEKCINAEIADTPEKRERGLMNGEGLDQNNGMLFVFPEEGQYPFWMKNMKFPIDIIWINRDYRIVHIEKDAQPCRESCKSYYPKDKAIYVVEVNANFTEIWGIRVNSTTLSFSPA